MARKLLSTKIDLTPQDLQSEFSGMSSPDNALTRNAYELQTAVSAHDRSQAACLLPNLLQNLTVSPGQRHIQTTEGLQLLQLGAQALNLVTGNLQVPQPVQL